MTDIRHVLCPVDRSDISRHALQVAAAVAQWHDASLRVMEVISAPELQPAVGPVAVKGLSMEMRRTVLRELDRFAEPARIYGVPMHFEVDEGDVVAGILEEAQELPADLIVIGTHGRSGFEHFALGSVAEKVLRRARCPVLTVPPSDRGLPHAGAPFKRIVCAVDFSEASLKGLEYAYALAQESDAQLIMTHVIDWPEDTSLPEALAKAIAATRHEWEGEKRRQLQLLVPESAEMWCRPEPLLLVGDPAKELLRLAREREADLIIMGVHGRGSLDIAVFGSTAHKVAREAPCPVMTVRVRK